MKFISWNVNGFRAVLGKGFADIFRELDADFFALQETKMQEGQADFSPEGYHAFWFSAEKKGYSGTAIFAKKEPISVKYGLGIPEHDNQNHPSQREAGLMSPHAHRCRRFWNHGCDRWHRSHR